MRIKLLLALISCMGMAGCVGHRSFDTDGDLEGTEFDIGDPCYSPESCKPEFMRGFPINWPENK